MLILFLPLRWEVLETLYPRALLLAGIIFFWAYSFIGESVTKNGQAVDQVCKDVVFEAEVFSGKLLIKNVGDIPMWGVQVLQKNSGDLIEVQDFSDTGIKSGETAEVDLGGYDGDSVVSLVLMVETETE